MATASGPSLARWPKRFKTVVALIAGGVDADPLGAAAHWALWDRRVGGHGLTGGPGSGVVVGGAEHGRFVAFASYADNLVPGDTNRCKDQVEDVDRSCIDVFVHDRKSGTTERVSVDSAGSQGNDDSYGTAISADGRFVAFDSTADNLVPGDTKSIEDVFVHDRKTGATTLVSVDSAGNQGNSYSFDPAISADGRFVAFWSYAGNLVPGDTNATVDVFVHDRKTKVAETDGADLAGE